MKQSDFTYDDFTKQVNVSRETFDRLRIYGDLLLKWQKKINLVSPKSLDNFWERHFLDSAQLFRLISSPKKDIFDLGSGAGFPGLVLSIMGVEKMHLIESDQRKCIFLSEVIRETGASAQIFNQRIESVATSGKKAHTVSSRACAPLAKLLAYAHPLLEEGGECIFLKGEGATEEIEDAKREWLFHVKQHPSITHKEGCILTLSDINKR